jgi:hypothetical protein
MTKSTLMASTAIGLLLCIAPAIAQEKRAEEKTAPAHQREPGVAQKDQQGGSRQKAEAKSKGAQGEMKEHPGKGTAQAKPNESKGTAEKTPAPQGKAKAGTAEKSPVPKNKGTQGTAAKVPGPEDKNSKGAANESKQSGNGNHVQLTDEKRANLSQSILKDRNINRVSNINVAINVGTLLPRSVHIVRFPASAIEIVPEYRNYSYFVIDDEICVVEPNSYEIVEIIPASGQLARRGDPSTLVLSDEEKSVVLREVDMGSGSTLALGALTEGSDVPRGVQVRKFPETIVQKVPKLKGHSFFTAEKRLAIVDQHGTKVQLVLEELH